MSAAAGRVKVIRDGMFDRLIDRSERVKLKGTECGNGVVVDHGSGWETQYCHLRQGRIAKPIGALVTRGENLGYLGFSGLTEFAHLHFTVRYKGNVRDPFTNQSPNKECKRTKLIGLWKRGVEEKLGSPKSRLLGAGFSSKPVNTKFLEIGLKKVFQVNAVSPALIFHTRFMKLKRNDRINLNVSGPDGYRVGN